MQLETFEDRLSRRNKLARLAWACVWLVLFRPSPTPLHGWRRLLLRAFGARLAPSARVYPSARIWAPWNLTLGERACLADGVICYSVAAITVGDDTVVSQRSHLCGATHDYLNPSFPMVAKPIVVGRGAWIAAEAFVGPGVTIGDAAVVGARACVVKSVAAGAVVAGNPARVVKRRPEQKAS